MYPAVTNRISRARDDEDGQALVEYSLILLFIALVAVTTLGAVGNAVESMFSAVLAGF